MTRLQKLQLEQSEVREKIGGLLDKEDRTADDRTSLSWSQLTKRAQVAGGRRSELQSWSIEEPETEVDTEHGRSRVPRVDSVTASAILVSMTSLTRPIHGSGSRRCIAGVPRSGPG